MLLIDRFIYAGSADGQPAKDMPRDTRNFYIMCLGQMLYVIHLRVIEIANFFVPDKLKFSLGQFKFVHDSQRMLQFAADAIGVHTKFSHFHWPVLLFGRHLLPPLGGRRYINESPTT